MLIDLVLLCNSVAGSGYDGSNSSDDRSIEGLRSRNGFSSFSSGFSNSFFCNDRFRFGFLYHFICEYESDGVTIRTPVRSGRIGEGTERIGNAAAFFGVVKVAEQTADGHTGFYDRVLICLLISVVGHGSERESYFKFPAVLGLLTLAGVFDQTVVGGFLTHNGDGAVCLETPGVEDGSVVFRGLEDVVDVEGNLESVAVVALSVVGVAERGIVYLTGKIEIVLVPSGVEIDRGGNLDRKSVV